MTIVFERVYIRTFVDPGRPFFDPLPINSNKPRKRDSKPITFLVPCAPQKILASTPNSEVESFDTKIVIPKLLIVCLCLSVVSTTNEYK